MRPARLMAWGFVSGLVASVVVTWWPDSWEYAPGIIFGATLAASFAVEIWKAQENKFIVIFGLASFVGLSTIAYYVSLVEAEWILGTNGFADFSSYASSTAVPALCVACFVGGCIGALILSVGIRLFFFKFDLVRGIFLFSIGAGALSSLVIVGFDIFGFIPQFLFPFWHLGASGIVGYIHKMSKDG